MSEYLFDNGYGASVIDYGYGSSQGLKELAVLHSNNNELCYATPITDDVIGYLTDDDLADVLTRIEALKPNHLCNHKGPQL